MDKSLIHNNLYLTVHIKSLEETHFEGKALAISCTDEKGPFDVLPNHQNFIAIIQYNITVHMENEKKNFIIDSGILKVYENTVYVFLGIQKLG